MKFKLIFQIWMFLPCKNHQLHGNRNVNDKYFLLWQKLQRKISWKKVSLSTNFLHWQQPKMLRPNHCTIRSKPFWSCNNIFSKGQITANIFESGPMPTAWKFLQYSASHPKMLIGSKLKTKPRLAGNQIPFGGADLVLYCVGVYKR